MDNKHNDLMDLMDDLAGRSSLTQQQGELLWAAVQPLLLLASSGALEDDAGMVEWRTQGRFGRAIEAFVAQVKQAG